jgi:hypothetical protein
MGCDIHGWVEKKKDQNNGWVAVCKLKNDDRNYDRFAKLAGVRGDGPEPNGIPQDVAETTKLDIDSWDADGHSHTYLPLKDALKIFAETTGL